MIQEILKDIDQKKDQKIDQIHKERDEQILVLKNQIKEKIAKRIEEEADSLRKENEVLLTEFSQIKDTENNFLVQKEKNKIIQTVWDRVEQKINELSEKEYAEIIVSLMKFIPKISGNISASKRAFPVLKKNLKDSKMKIKDDLDEEGFVVKGDDLELNFKVTEILEQMKEEHNPEIIKTLFTE